MAEDGKKKTKQPSIHAGHRQRLKGQFLVRGLEGMPDHQALELLLFFAIPQGDVNPTAHALMDRFGTLSSVLTARYEDLLTVPGIGPNAAALICLVPQICRRFMTDRARLGGQLTTAEDYAAALSPYFFGARVEMCYMLCLDGMGKLITCCRLGEGVLDQVNVPQRRVVETALRHNASQVVLAHNHVSGFAMPSRSDIKYTLDLKKLLEQVDVILVDHLIIVDGRTADVDDGCRYGDMVSMAQSGYLDRSEG